MKKLLPGGLVILALFLVLATSARADEFDQIASSPATYWVPAPGYAYAPPPGPYGYPYPPGYYPPPGPPPPPVVVFPRFFIGFHFH